MPRLIVIVVTAMLNLWVPAAPAAGVLPVYVSVAPQRYLVERVGGERVSVEVLLPAGQAPETWDPSAQQLRGLERARLYFLAGVPFERARLEALQRLAGDTRLVSCCESLLTEAERGLDPHVWTSPAKAADMAGLIHRELVRADPEGEVVYSANHERLRRDLEHLDADIRRRLAGRRIDIFITAHAAWGHLARAYGLKELSLERNGREIGARGLAELVRRARQAGITTVFSQSQYRTPLVDNLAAQLGAQVVPLDPLAVDYLDNLRRVSKRLAGAMQ